MRYYFSVLFLVVMLLVPWMAYNYPIELTSLLDSIGRVGGQFAAVILSHNPKTVDDLKLAYNNAGLPGKFQEKVKILLVPGHEPDLGGAEYGDIKERILAVDLAEDLKKFFEANNRYQVTVTRDKQKWNPIFSEYFKNGWNEIIEWQAAHREHIDNLKKLGQFKPIQPSVIHNKAPSDVAYRLYGIDKWVNENDIDIVIHIHFNDYARRNSSEGKYSGFTIYVPEKSYNNNASTHAVADAIFKRVEKYNAVSDLPGESRGIVEDPDLIALGSYNSVDAASMLIEYGYIYEPQFTNPVLRDDALKDLAFQTFLGVQDFFDPRNVANVAGQFDTLLLPRNWSHIADKDMLTSDVFALQTALSSKGFYPPRGRTKNECPRSGTFGQCTREALEGFQKHYKVEGEKGKIGIKTVEALNSAFAPQSI